MKDLSWDDGHVDITDPDVYVKGVPHRTFERLRNTDPVSWQDERDGSGFWAVTRYDDIVEVMKNTAVFSSAQGIRLEEMQPDELEARRTMMELDPPEHLSYRRLVQPAFLNRVVKTYEDELRALTVEVIEDLDERTEFDFVSDIARKLPMRMLGKLLGVPDEDGPRLVELGDALIGNSDEEYTSHPVDLVDTEDYRLLPFRSPHSAELFDYGERMAQARRACPGEDIVTRLLTPRDDGSLLTDEEFKNFFALLVAAGNDTTRYTMAAGLDALLDTPAEFSALQSDLDLMPTATDEMMRYGSVTMHFRRTATQDTQLGGREIKAGQKVVIWFISANFDERQFPDPYRFDVRRSPNAHAAFGRKSIHMCLGMHLARLEVRVLFEELLPRIREIHTVGSLERLRSNFISGIKHMPVHVTWA